MVSLPDLTAKIRVDTTDLHSGFGRATDSSNRFGSTLRTGLATAAVAAGTAIGAMGVLATVTGIKTAASMEQAGVAFTTLLGSAEKAKGFLGELSSFAAKTPFELPGLIDASRQLLGVGQSADSVIPTLTALGNTSGALGLSQESFSRAMLAVTQSMAKGKIQAEELMQITEAGIPIWQILSQALGKPVPEIQKLSSEGKLLAEEVWPKVFDQMNKNYGGAMEAQSKTLAGAWSTLTDTVKMSLAEAFQPLVPVLAKILPRAAQVFGDSMHAVTKVLTGIGPALGDVATSGGKFQKVFEKAGQNIGKLRELFSSVFNDIQDVVKDNEGTFRQWGERIASIMESLQGIVGPVIDLIAVLWDAGGKRALQLVVLYFGGILLVIDGVLKAISGMLKFWTALFTGDWSGALEGLKQAWSGFWEVIRGVLQIALAQILIIVNSVLVVLQVVFGAWIDALKTMWGGAWEFVRNLAVSVWNSILSFLRAIWAALVAAFTSSVNAIKGVVSWFGGLPGMFGGWFNSAKNAATSAMGGLVDFMRGVPGRIVSAIGNVGGLLNGIGRDIINGLANGVRSAAGAVGDAVRSIVNNIPEAVRKIMHISSPSKVMRALGQYTGQGYELGILDFVPRVEQAALALAGVSFPNVGAGGVNSTIGSEPNGGGTSNSYAPTINVRNGASASEILDEFSWRYGGSSGA